MIATIISLVHSKNGKDTEAVASLSEETTEGTVSPAVLNEPLEENKYPAVNELVQSFYTALAEDDMDTVKAFRAVIPSMMSQIVSIIKSTSLLASINIFEYLFTCNTVMVNSTSLSGIFTVYAMEAAGYFIVCYLLVILVNAASKRLRYA